MFESLTVDDMIHTLPAVAGIMLATRTVLPISNWFGDLICVAAFLSLYLGVSTRWNARWPARFVIISGLSGTTYLALLAHAPAARLALLAWVFACLFWVERFLGDKRRGGGGHFLILWLAGLGYAALLAWYAQSARVWFALRGVASLFVPGGGAAGIWVSGLPIWVFGVIALSTASLLKGLGESMVPGLAKVHTFLAGPTRIAGGAMIAGVVMTAGVAISASVAMIAGVTLIARISPLTFWRVALLQALAITLVAILVARVGANVRLPARFLRHVLVCGVLVTLLLVVQPVVRGRPLRRTGNAPGLVDGVDGRAGSGRQPLSIGLYSKGLLDWNAPTAGALGLLRSGMFGLFRKSLDRYARGHGGAVVEVDSLSRSMLSGLGIMVFINPTRRLTDSEKSVLSGFVQAGGGLLVLGDHTDIGGSRQPLNGILEFTSMEINFDSAISMRERWRGCLELRQHAVTRGLGDHIDTQMGTGASLRICRPAYPIMIGRYAYSDRGDYRNGGRGAYMGNCRPDAGEALGDIVLVAGEEVGLGKVLVFGDTSPFQNGAHFLSQRLIANAVRWVSPGRVSRCAAAGGMTVGWRAFGRTGGGRVAGSHGGTGIRPFDDVAVIDFSMNPSASRALFTERSLGGLANCFYRAGITPVPAYDASGWTRDAAYMIMISPTRRPGVRDVIWLADYVRSGGRLVLAKGYTCPELCAPLLKEFGFEIEPIPLGRGDMPHLIKHKDAWPHRYSGPPDTAVYATAFNHPTVTTRYVGKGSFTFISDGRLLLDGNLESESVVIPENVAFFTFLLGRLRGTVVGSGEHRRQPCGLQEGATRESGLSNNGPGYENQAN